MKKQNSLSLSSFEIKSLILLCISFVFLNSCSTYHQIPNVKSHELENTLTSKQKLSLTNSVEKIVNAGGNHYRKKAIIKQLSSFGLEENTRQERIDWLSVQKNIVVDIPGESDSLIYVVAHYDKTDLNPFKIASIYLNGLLDPLVSWSYTTQGAIDNATGVAVALQLAKSIAERNNKFSYRILFAGSEESGLRGSRAHVARLSLEEFDRIKFVVNVDVVGVKGKQNCVYTVSDDDLEQDALIIAKQNNIDLGVGTFSIGATSDYLPFKKTSFGLDFARSFAFNLTGSLLPQRSYFTKKKSTKVINFSACQILDFGDHVSGWLLLPVGSIHGFRDNIKQVDLDKLYEMYQLINLFLHKEEKSITAN